MNINVYFLTTVRHGHPSLTTIMAKDWTAAKAEVYEFVNDQYGGYVLTDDDIVLNNYNVIVWSDEHYLKATLIRA